MSSMVQEISFFWRSLFQRNKGETTLQKLFTQQKSTIVMLIKLFGALCDVRLRPFWGILKLFLRSGNFIVYVVLLTNSLYLTVQ